MDKILYKAIVQAAWRRRHLIMWPLMILLPMSALAAWMMPRQYQATALIMIPEAPGFGSSQTGYAYSQDMAAKMKGVDALLKSDFILADVLSRESDGQKRAGAIKDRIDDLRKRLGTKPVSDNFVQVTLNGAEKDGLGDQLNSVLASLFEGLLTPTQSANDAVTFVARQRQAEIEAIERRIKDLEAREPKLTEAMVRDHVDAGNSAEDRIAAKQRLLDSDRARLQREIEGIVGPAIARAKDPRGVPTEVLLGQIISDRRAQLEAFSQKGEAQSDAAKALAGTIEKLSALVAQQKDTAELADELKVEQERVESVQAMARNLASLMQQRKQLYDEADHARNRYRQLMERLRGTTGSASLNLLRTPAQVQVVDAPSDPTRPTTSRLKLLLIGIGASFAFSIGLATLVEQLDPTLRSAEQLAAVTDLPVLARFDTWPSESSPDDDDARSKSRTRPPLHTIGGGGGPAGSNIKQVRS